MFCKCQTCGIYSSYMISGMCIRCGSSGPTIPINNLPTLPTPDFPLDTLFTEQVIIEPSFLNHKDEDPII